MITPKLIYWLFTVKSVFSSCLIERHFYGFNHREYNIHVHKSGKLPSCINESSGICFKNDTLYHCNDSGDLPRIYSTDINGALLDTLIFNECKNVDWEEIQISKNQLLIGDIGNNANNRKDLKIYQVKDSVITKPIVFEDQKDFPPILKNEKNFDCEAFVEIEQKIYLFSKNRGKGLTKVYLTTDSIAKIVGHLKLRGSVTGASVNALQDLLTIITYGKIYLFKIQKNQEGIDFQPLYARRIGRAKQNEAITFIGSHEMIMTNEQGDFFKLRIKK